MRRFYLSFLLAFVTAISGAQDSKFSVGIAYSADFTENEYQFAYIGFPSVEYGDVPQFGIGAQLNYFISEKLGIRLGLLYSRRATINNSNGSQST